MMANNFLNRVVRGLQLSENSLLLLLAVGVGLSTGAAVWLFQEGIDFFHHLFREELFTFLPDSWGDWRLVIVLGLAGLIVGTGMRFFVGEQRHHGVAGIIEATALAGGRLPYLIMPVKAIASALSLGAGASVGPEDPSVQIGANLGSMFGQKLYLSEERIRLLVASGSASAIAAAFNAPIAGAFFALEVILADFTTGSVGVVVLAAVMSAVFTQSVSHGGPELGIREYELGGAAQIPFYILLGLLAAPIAAAFIRLVYWQHDRWHHLPKPFSTVLAGVLVGIVGVYFPQILGTGHETMNEVLNTGGGDFTIRLLFALVFIKMLMTSVSMAGGFVGGIFAPSLFVGAMLGGAYGRVVEEIVPGVNVGDPAAYAIAGMGAMMAGVVRAPITAILLIFEMTNNYQLILPIMLTTVVCVYFSERLESSGIYALGLKRQGFHLQHGRDVDVMQSILVEEVMRTPPPTILPAASLSDLRNAFRDCACHAVCVVDERNDLIGIVTLSDLQKAYDQVQQADSAGNRTVADICSHDPVTIPLNEPVWTAIRVMGQHDYQTLPVVTPENPRHLVGLLRRRDVMRGYTIAMSRKWESQYIQTQIRLNNLVNENVIELRVAPNASVAGKRIKDITLPEASIIASIRRGNKTIFPHGSTELYAHDVLTIIAEPAVENRLRNLIEPSGKNPR